MTDTDNFGLSDDIASPRPSVASADELSRVLVLLLKGVVYRDTDVSRWAHLLSLQSRARDYLRVLTLDLVIDEAEGYAFVKSRGDDADDASAEDAEPTLSLIHI